MITEIKQFEYYECVRIYTSSFVRDLYEPTKPFEKPFNYASINDRPISTSSKKTIPMTYDLSIPPTLNQSIAN